MEGKAPRPSPSLSKERASEPPMPPKGFMPPVCPNFSRLLFLEAAFALRVSLSSSALGFLVLLGFLDLFFFLLLVAPVVPSFLVWRFSREVVLGS